MSPTINNVLTFLFFSGVRAVMYQGRLRENDLLEPSAPIISEPPEFVAKGFLETLGSKTPVMALQHPKHAKKAQKDIVAIEEKCHQSCGKVLESGCAAECKVKTFACLDYDRATKVGAETYLQCERASLTKYEKYSQGWESTHPRLANLLAKKGHEHFKGAVVDSLQDQCKDACGQGVDSSCVPECQVEMYQCLDFDKQTPAGLKKYEACEKVVMEKYKSFAADWDATHPYLLAIGRHVSSKHLQLVHDMCESGCKHNSGGSCIPRCEVSSYSCFSDDSQVSSDTDRESCIGKVVSQTSKGETDLKVTVNQFKDIETACRNNCGLGADHGCLPECQVQMYACSRDDEPKKQSNEKARDYSTCTRSVLARYEKFSIDWNTAHPYLLAVRGHADAADLDDLHESCVDACGPNVDSTCVPECHVKVYACLDQKIPNDASPYKKCVRDVLASYERFADDWEAAHPYLLAVRRHVSETELLRALDKCEAACGKGVDSSCVPECQVEMYTCLDHDQKTSDGAKLYDECESKVMAEYKKFGTNWDAVHPY